MALTERRVEAMRPNTVIWDRTVPAFGCRRRNSRVRTFILMRRIDGRLRLLTMGRWGAITVAQARRLALAAVAEIAAGRDPIEAKRRRVQAASVSDALDRYLAVHVAHHNRESTAREVRRLVERLIRPVLGTQRVADLRKADVVAWHTLLARTPRQANFALAALSKALALAEEWGGRPAGSNPCRGLRRFPEGKRDRIASEEELARIGAALTSLESDGRISASAALCIRLLAVTGLRAGEIRTLRWADIDREHALIRLRQAKTGDRVHALPTAAADLLVAVETNGDFVCSSADPTRPLSSSALEHAWAKVRTRAEVPDLRLHDLRHGVGTFAAEIGGTAWQVRDLLGHAGVAMTSRYVSRVDAPHRALADRVGARMAQALGGKVPATVADLSARRRPR